MRQPRAVQDLGCTDNHTSHEACVYGTKTTLLVTGFLTKILAQDSYTSGNVSNATRPVQVAVAASPIESNQRTLIPGLNNSAT